MPYYMFQGSYTPAAWAGMLKKPQHRLKAIQSAVKKLGGNVEGGWLPDQVCGELPVENPETAARSYHQTRKCHPAGSYERKRK